ncbi:unnamed protein product, partial [Chrysoparadoxa australica]
GVLTGVKERAEAGRQSMEKAYYEYGSKTAVLRQRDKKLLEMWVAKENSVDEAVAEQADALRAAVHSQLQQDLANLGREGAEAEATWKAENQLLGELVASQVARRQSEKALEEGRGEAWREEEHQKAGQWLVSRLALAGKELEETLSCWVDILMSSSAACIALDEGEIHQRCRREPPNAEASARWEATWQGASARLEEARGQLSQRAADEWEQGNATLRG